MQIISKIFGLNNIEIEIYLKLFEKNNSTVKDLVKITDISQAKIYTILSTLEEKGLITSKLANVGKTKIYNAISPQKLDKLIKSNLNELQEKSDEIIYNLQQKFDQLHSKGVCQLKPTHFLITKKELALNKIKEYFSKAEREVIFIGVPLWLIDEFYDHLIFLKLEKQCNIEIYLPQFEVIPKQFNKLKIFSPKIIKIPHYQLIEINQEIYYNCEVIIDKKYLVAVSYNESFDIILNSFSGINCIKNCILPNLYHNLVISENELLKKVSKENRIIEILRKENKPLSKKELSIKAGLSGRTLNDILEKLVNINKISIYEQKSGKGRPRTEIKLI
ncbi:MAG: TrmB family transcriptional regulator [Candidatus Helarchaeota archaeon]